MDEQNENNAQPPDDQALEAAAHQPSPAEDQSDATSDAVKARGVEPAVDGDAQADDTLDASAVREPSMDFANATAGNEVDAGEAAHDIRQEEPQAHPAEFPQFGQGTQPKVTRNIDLLLDVKLPVSIELGRATLPISEILEWGQGSVIELDRLAGEPVDLMVNNKLVARGEVVVVDEKFGLRITSLISPRERLDTL